MKNIANTIPSKPSISASPAASHEHGKAVSSTSGSRELVTELAKPSLKAIHIQHEREAHHAALLALAKSLGYPGNDGKALWRKLNRIEREAHAGATAYCNGEKFLTFDFNRDENAWENFAQWISAKVEGVFGKLPPGFFVNGDARGYALKLASSRDKATPFPLHSDWGSNQILAPTIE